jgi:hypothetical protein
MIAIGEQSMNTRRRTGCELPVQRPSHTIYGQTGEDFGDDGEAGLLDSETRVKFVLGFAELPYS